jgi:hypothetical protein
MGRIDLSRVILGGVVAGIIINVFEFVLNGIVLADRWTNLMTSINRPPLGTVHVIAFNLLGFARGIAAVWTYAAIRPRFGAGPKTAVSAALLTWITAYVLGNATLTITSIFSMSMTLTLAIVALVQIIVATVAGAYFYKETA